MSSMEVVECLEKYQKLELIHYGKFASVCFGKLKNRPHPATVAIKQNFRFGFAEIRAYKDLKNCDKILKVFDICDNYKTIVLELCMSSLYELLGCQSLCLPQQKNVIRQFLNALEAIHSKNFVHRDVKSANLLMTFDGVLKIADLEGMLENNVNMANFKAGTPGFTPPEVLISTSTLAVNISMDLWSAGITLFEILTNVSKDLIDHVKMSEIRSITNVFGCVAGPYLSSLPGYEEYYEWAKFYEERNLADTLRLLMAENTQAEMDIIEKLLKVEPSERASVSQLLESDFFSVEPLPSADLTEAIEGFMRNQNIERPPQHDEPEIDWDNIVLPDEDPLSPPHDDTPSNDDTFLDWKNIALPD
ncbi:cyclin-dependent kinase 9-like [Nilaparvata lugens]|uniref:cyclin-dependent kinase 9-like n=1 Tax=Nilaparvata lugens TaxID=108931 RepID=UPI00193DFA03|nr:cyclin-dependent kinase 9-like [Nilaparvata lugens]